MNATRGDVRTSTTDSVLSVHANICKYIHIQSMYTTRRISAVRQEPGDVNSIPAHGHHQWQESLCCASCTTRVDQCGEV